LGLVKSVFIPQVIKKGSAENLNYYFLLFFACVLAPLLELSARCDRAELPAQECRNKYQMSTEPG